MSRTTRKRWVFGLNDLDPMRLVTDARDHSCKPHCSCRWSNSPEKRRRRRQAARELRRIPTTDEARHELALDEE